MDLGLATHYDPTTQRAIYYPEGRRFNEKGIVFLLVTLPVGFADCQQYAPYDELLPTISTATPIAFDILTLLLCRICCISMAVNRHAATSNYQSATTSNEKKVKRSPLRRPFHLRSKSRRASRMRRVVSSYADAGFAKILFLAVMFKVVFRCFLVMMSCM